MRNNIHKPETNVNVFLETTVMVDYLMKDNAKKAAISEILTKYKKTYSSHYVKMEFKRGFIQRLVYLHGKVILTKNIADVFSSISRLSSTQHKNLLGSTLESIANFFQSPSMNKKMKTILKSCENISPNEYIIEAIETVLSNQISTFWIKFDKAVDEVLNSQQCFMDLRPPVKKTGKDVYDNTPRECTKSELQCGIREFINQNLGDFIKILKKLKTIKNPDIETKKRIKSLKMLTRVPKRPVSEKDCWNCGDAILAVEAPIDSAVFNNNVKHYEPICEAIEKNSLSYD